MTKKISNKSIGIMNRHDLKYPVNVEIVQSYDY